MTILANYTTFRYVFADRKLSVPDAGMTFAAGPPSTISRAAGSFLTNGVATGMYCEPSGTTSNNGKRVYITAVTSSLITCDPSGATLAAEGAAIGQQLSSFFVAGDAMEEWPGPFSQTSDLVRANSFDNGIALSTALVPGSLVFTVDSNAADTVPGTDEYDWYLSQHVDDPAGQILSVDPYDPNPPATYSGSVQLSFSAFGSAYLAGISGILSPSREVQIFYKRCDLYVRRKSDGAIQWRNIFAALQAN